MGDNTRDYFTSASNLTGHLQRRMMQRKNEGDEWVGDQLLKRRLDNLAYRIARSRKDSVKDCLKHAAEKAIEREVEERGEQEKYRQHLRQSIIAFSRPVNKRCLGQGQNPYGVVPFYMKH